MKNVMFVLLAVLTAIASSAVAQAPQINRPTAAALYNACGSACASDVARAEVARDSESAAIAHSRAASARSRAVAASAAADNNVYITLSGPGSYITGVAGSSLSINVLREYGEPVWLAGRLFTTDNAGMSPATSSEPFYLPKNLAVTGHGPGYFDKLAPGAVFPIGDLGPSIAGDIVVLQLTVFDVRSGQPLQNVFTTFYPFVSSISPPVSIRTVSITNNIVMLTGHLPLGMSTLLVGQPGWDVAVVSAASDGLSMSFPVPPSGNGGGQLLYPAGWTATAPWTINLITAAGNVYTFPNVVTVRGNGAGVTMLQ